MTTTYVPWTEQECIDKRQEARDKVAHYQQAFINNEIDEAALNAAIKWWSQWTNITYEPPEPEYLGQDYFENICHHAMPIIKKNWNQWFINDPKAAGLFIIECKKVSLLEVSAKQLNTLELKLNQLMADED